MKESPSFELSLLPIAHPSRRHKLAAVTVIVVLTLVAIVALPLRDRELPRLDSFIPIVDACLLIMNLIAAALLYAQLSIVRTLGLRVLAGSYLFTALIIVPHVLVFPGVLFPTGLFNAGLQGEMWLYIFWHAALPPAAIAYATIKGTRADHMANYGTPTVPVLVDICVVVCIVATLTWLAVAGSGWQPDNVRDARYVDFLWQKVGAPVSLAVIITAMIFVWLRRSSALDLWLFVVLWIWFLEIVLLAMTSYHINFGWYVGRLLGLASSCVMTFVLLKESALLYVEMAGATNALGEGSERRSKVVEVVLKSFADELLERISAIMANGSAGVLMINRNAHDLNELKTTFEEIVNEGRRATTTLTSMRGMFSKHLPKQE